MEKSFIKPDNATVMYREGPFNWSKQHVGTLEWTPGDRINLSLTVNKSPVLLFDVPLSDIRKVGGALSYLTFYLKDKKYRLDVYDGIVPTNVMAAPSTRLINEVAKYRESDALKWITAFKLKNVRTSYLNGKRFTSTVVLATAGVLILATLLVLAVDQF